MKRITQYLQHTLWFTGFCLLAAMPVLAQETAPDTTKAAVTANKKAVKNTFAGSYLIDNQSVIVPVKGTFEFDFQHRFGLVNTNGISDLFGLYSGATIRLGFSYVPIKNLQVGFGSLSDPMSLDFNAKYSIVQQTKDNSMPVSVTWFSNVLVDVRSKSNFATSTDRFSYFNQLIIARKITDKFSVQVAPSLSHYNNVPGNLVDAEGNIITDPNTPGAKIQRTMYNDHWAISFSGRYRVTEGTAVILNYDQPLTVHPMDNPRPNISFGAEFTTSAHVFQVFFGNYSYIVPQRNNYFNQNDYKGGQYLIGFNISRLWNF
jgi:hypothetical protein